MIHSAYASVENLWLDIPVGLGIQILGYKQKLTFLGDFFFLSLSRSHTHSRVLSFFLFRSNRGKKETKQKNKQKATPLPPPFYFQKVTRKK